MTSKNHSVHRTVFIDPDGTAPEWAFVLMPWPSGVYYQHHYGGTATRQGEVEGYLVPVDGTVARGLLDEVFVRTLRSVGTWGRSLEPDLLDAVRGAVGLVRFWPDSQGSAAFEALRLDDDRTDDLDEAWVPVLTSDGPGTLIWPNSD